MPELLVYLSALSVLFPIGISLRYFSSYDPIRRGLSFFFYLSGFFELVGQVTVHYKWNNLPLFHSFTLIELLFFSWVYYHVFHGQLLKRIVAGLTALLAAFTLLNALLLENIWSFNSVSRTAESIYLVVLALLFFRQLLLQNEMIFLDKEPLFWLNSGVLLYFAGNIFLFMLQHALSSSGQPDRSLYWLIHSLLNILTNFLYGIALLCRPKLQT